MYDFKSLSSHDFELLVRDLLQKHLKVFLESFKAGRDKGIDLRYAAARDDTLIVQCKHYAETGYAGLLTTLTKEASKVKRLAPARYCIATSVPLTPKNKDDIVAVFSPFCKAGSDIFGLGELNNLLCQFAEIERQHFKLWLTSSTILDTLIHSGVYNQTSTLVDTIRTKARRYVQNTSFFDAQDILKDHNYCIISGIPGIGKTFLAEMLLLQHIGQGYQPVVVRHHIREAFDMLRASSKQVFYYDDFLGQTGWDERLEKNEEQGILDFVRYVRDHQHVRFILTTREYILQRARSVYEKLHAPEFDNAKCIVKLESYTRRNRAHILFNHIYFSSLAPEHRRMIVQRKPLLTIVDHRNYSPRIIEWMSDYRNIKDVAPEDYPQKFLDTLERPTELWLHAFRNHISHTSRSLLIVMMSFNDAVDLTDLKEGFEAFRNHEVVHLGGVLGPSELTMALDELEGSFVRCERDTASVVVAFHNPSVRDFLEQYMAENAEIVHTLCSSAVFYEQIMTLCGARPGKPEREQIVAIAQRQPKVLAESIIRSVGRSLKQKRLVRTSAGAFVSESVIEATMEAKVAHALNLAKQLPETVRLELSKRLIDSVTVRVSAGNVILGEVTKTIISALCVDGVSSNTEMLIAATTKRFEDAAKSYEELDEIVALQEFAQSVPLAISPDLVFRVKARLEEDADGIFDYDITQADDENDIGLLREIAHAFEQTFNVDLNSIDERLGEKLDEIRTAIDEPPDNWFERTDDTGSDATDADIVAMFGDFTE